MKATKINQIPDNGQIRYSSGISGFDELLGHDTNTNECGFVPGEVLLFAGEPGAGKSTLLLQIANNMAQAGHRILYTTGEESLGQVKKRANRLKTLNGSVYCSETINLEEFYKVADELDPKLIIIDSLQMVYSSSCRGEPGSPSQMKYTTRNLIKYAKDSGRILVLVAHTTKSGIIAGAMTIQFLVDANFRMFTDTDKDIRTVFVEKNRFGFAKTAWRARMTTEGLLDVNENKINNVAIEQTVNHDIARDESGVDTITLNYDQIKVALDKSFVNRYAINSDVKWLYEQIYGRIEARINKINKFHITIEVEKI